MVWFHMSWRKIPLSMSPAPAIASMPRQSQMFVESPNAAMAAPQSAEA